MVVREFKHMRQRSFTKRLIHQIDNDIEDEGVKALCEALKVNTGLEQLELQSQGHRCVESRLNRDRKNLILPQAVDLESKEQGH